MAPVARATRPSALEEPLIRGKSTPETRWLSWLASAGLGSCPLDEWLAADARLVVVAPHPDDEVLGCGGLLASHAARGGDCLLIAVTDGEASHPPTPQRNAVQLAHTRRKERREGCAQLGLHRPAIIRLGLPDGRVQQYRTRLLRALLVLLRSTDVVVTTWREDGHPDHEASGHGAAEACASVGARLIEAPVWMWHWAAPGDPRVPWQKLQGLPVDPITVQRKCAALAAHVSQLERPPEQEGAVLGEAIQARAARRVEYFFV